MSLQKIKVPNIFSVAKGEKSSAYFDPVDILNLGANSKYNLRVYNEATNDFSFFPKRDTIKSDLFIPPSPSLSSSNGYQLSSFPLAFSSIFEKQLFSRIGKSARNSNPVMTSSAGPMPKAF